MAPTHGTSLELCRDKDGEKFSRGCGGVGRAIESGVGRKT